MNQQEAVRTANDALTYPHNPMLCAMEQSLTDIGNGTLIPTDRSFVQTLVSAAPGDKMASVGRCSRGAIERLDRLHQAGRLTEEEFSKKKTGLLAHVAITTRLIVPISTLG